MASLGDRLAPERIGACSKPGMRSLSIQGQREDGFEGSAGKGRTIARYEHSIYIEVNDHYVLRSAEDKLGSAKTRRNPDDTVDEVDAAQHGLESETRWVWRQKG